MPCIALPAVPLPTLPSPFTIPSSINVGIGSPGVNLCCKLPPVALPPIPLPLAGISLLLQVNGFVDVLTAAVAVVTGYVNQLPLKCPVE